MSLFGIRFVLICFIVDISSSVCLYLFVCVRNRIRLVLFVVLLRLYMLNIETVFVFVCFRLFLLWFDFVLCFCVYLKVVIYLAGDFI